MLSGIVQADVGDVQCRTLNAVHPFFPVRLRIITLDHCSLKHHDVVLHAAALTFSLKTKRAYVYRTPISNNH